MTSPNPVESREPGRETPSLAPDARTQATVDAEHATTGWNPYKVWRERVFVPQKTGYNKPRGNT